MLLTSERPALLGGIPVCAEPWPKASTIGEDEKRAALEVLDSGGLSGFRAGPGPRFFGGSRVRKLEQEWADYFGTQHAVAFNSLTSGLQAAIGALRIGPGDEVIVPPLTMSASAVCPLVYGAVPIFADVDPDTFCMDPASVEKQVTDRTRAVIVVHLFGHPAPMDALLEVARRHDLAIIEDCAQAPAGSYRGKALGTLGHIGGFSLNVHKTIQTGEGGVMVTDNEETALRMRLIRNHGETAVESFGIEGLENTFGGNTRMTELEAAIASVQLRRLEGLTVHRNRLAARLDRALSRLPGLRPQRRLADGSRHAYYFYALRYSEEECGLPRELFVRAVRAEGIDLRTDYARPVYWEPLFQKRIALGRGGFPFRQNPNGREYRYPRGLCPVAESLFEGELVFGRFCHWPLTERHVDQVVSAFQKVIENRDIISRYAMGPRP